MNRHGAQYWLKIPAKLGTGVLLMLLAGCGIMHEPERHELPEEVTDFDHLFGQNCAGCHGANGQLGPAPPLNDPIFLAIAPVDALKKTIREGRPGTPMGPFLKENGGTLTSEQVDILVEGMRSRWSDPSQVPSKPLPPYAVPDASSGDAEAGKKVFAIACANCHGADGKGTRKAQVSHGGKGKDRDKQAGAVNDPVFLRLMSNQALRRIVITGRADFGMPHFANPDLPNRAAEFSRLSDQQIADLVALLISWRVQGQGSEQ